MLWELLKFESSLNITEVEFVINMKET
jgi:hypothetical protein